MGSSAGCVAAQTGHDRSDLGPKLGVGRTQIADTVRIHQRMQLQHAMQCTCNSQKPFEGLSFQVERLLGL